MSQPQTFSSSTQSALKPITLFDLLEKFYGDQTSNFINEALNRVASLGEDARVGDKLVKSLSNLSGSELKETLTAFGSGIEKRATGNKSSGLPVINPPPFGSNSIYGQSGALCTPLPQMVPVSVTTNPFGAPNLKSAPVFPGTFGLSGSSSPPSGFGGAAFSQPNAFSFRGPAPTLPERASKSSTAKPVDPSLATIRGKVEKLRTEDNQRCFEDLNHWFDSIKKAILDDRITPRKWNRFAISGLPKKYETAIVEFFEDLGLNYKREGDHFVYGIFPNQ